MDAQRIGRSREHSTNSGRGREKRRPTMTVDHLLKRQDAWLGRLKQRLVSGHVFGRLRISQSYFKTHRSDALDEQFDTKPLFLVSGQNCPNAIANVNHLLEA